MTRSINIELRLPRDLEALPKCEAVPTYDQEFDDTLSVVADLCKLLGRAEGVRFLISGFGHDDWKASVERELCILLEQLPSVAQALVRGSPEFTIEFVEQGFFRTLSFSGAGDQLEVSCVSGDAWTPLRQPASVSRKTLSTMLHAVVQQFCAAAATACPELVAHPWFAEWRTSVEALAPAILATDRDGTPRFTGRGRGETGGE